MDIRKVLLFAGVVALIAGVIGLLVPVSITGDDGQSIGCGNAIVADQSAARTQDDKRGASIPVIGPVLSGGSEYVNRCQSEVTGRRAWAIPVAALGALVIVGALVMGGRTRRPLGVR